MVNSGREKSRLQSGEVVDERIEIVRLIGEGGMGAVYEGRHLHTGRTVAVKVLQAHYDDDAALRFLEEARAVGKIRHPNVVDIYDAGLYGDSPYIVMECLLGHSLQELLRRWDALPAEDVAAIGQQAAAGIEAAHRVGLIHRDIKPANMLLVSPDDGREELLSPTEAQLKLLDFGLAKPTEGADLEERGFQTETGAIVGTPHYMSPEQAMGEEVAPSTDVYSLAATLYHAFTGATPFSGSSYSAILLNIVQEEPIPMGERRPVPASLEQVVMRALSKDPQQRPSIAEFGEAMHAATQDPLVTPSPTLPRAPTPAVEHSREDGPTDTRADGGVNTAPSDPTTVPADDATTAAGGARRYLVGGLLVVVLLGAFGVMSMGIEDGEQADATPDVDAREADTASTVEVAEEALAAPDDDEQPALVSVLTVANGTTEDAFDDASGWALASRVSRELDRYEEFRPVSPLALLEHAGRSSGSGPPALPDALVAKQIAQSLDSDFVVTLSATAREPVKVSGQIVELQNTENWRALPEVVLEEGVGGRGPGKLADAIAEKMGRLLGTAGRQPAPREARLSRTHYRGYSHHFAAERLCLAGRYEDCEALARKAIEINSENPLYRAQLGCALSFRGKDDEALAAVKKARELASKMEMSRRDRLWLEMDETWMRANAAFNQGKEEEGLELGRRTFQLATQISDEYQDPHAILYAGLAAQYLLQDPTRALELYARCRREAPSLYPCYQQEAQVLNLNARQKTDAAQLLWTFIECFPESDLHDVAKEDAEKMEFGRPEKPVNCPQTRL